MSLARDFLAPPFSVLDTRAGYWRERRRLFDDIIDGRRGRPEVLKGLASLTRFGLKPHVISAFDPVLCEILFDWFAPDATEADQVVVVCDPTAGGITRGFVAALCGYQYIGVDLSQAQVEENRAEWALLAEHARVKYAPIWIHGDAYDIAQHFREGLAIAGLPTSTLADVILTCPPYFTLEQYSDAEADLSNACSYRAFWDAMEHVLRQCARLLKSGSPLIVVIGNVRDATGQQLPLHSDLVCTCTKILGLALHQDAILINSMCAAAVRARRFMKTLKLVPVHQNCCVFSKGALCVTRASPTRHIETSRLKRMIEDMRTDACEMSKETERDHETGTDVVETTSPMPAVPISTCTISTSVTTSQVQSDIPIPIAKRNVLRRSKSEGNRRGKAVAVCKDALHEGERVMPLTSDYWYIYRSGNHCKQCKRRKAFRNRSDLPSSSDTNANATTNDGDSAPKENHEL